MARKVFFSFHYERDNWRVGQIRNSNIVTRSNIQSAGFIDAVSWEQVKRNGDDAIERWINGQLVGTTVTVVLIGAETSTRKWVDYEIKKSFSVGNGLLGIYIHNVKDALGRPDQLGANPFAKFNLRQQPLSNFIKTYDWVNDNGRENLGYWIEAAYQQRNAGL